MLDYFVEVFDSTKHLWRVVIEWHHADACADELYLPNWTAGSYKIRDYCQHSQNFHASCNGTPQLLQQTHKNRFAIPALAGDWHIEYLVYAFDNSVRGSFLDETGGFIHGDAVFWVPQSQRQNPISLTLRLPKNWQIATALSAKAPSIWSAKNYSDLLDNPILATPNLQLLSFQVNNIPHQIAIAGHTGRFDDAQLTHDVSRICQEHIALYGQAPFDHYVFLLMIGHDRYGGLEHLSSTALAASRRHLPQANQPNRHDYIELLGLFSHEYFHAWNVKTIRPAAFVASNHEHEAYTKLLWAFEGITSYYDNLALIRAEVINAQEYWQLWLADWQSVFQSYGRHIQTLAQSSFSAWDRFYQQNSNSPNAIVSYYKKGALAAFSLDLHIRRHSSHSLDDVMRALYQHALQQPYLGIGEQEWPQLASAAVGLDLSDILQQLIDSTDDWDMTTDLADCGVRLRIYPHDIKQHVVLKSEEPTPSTPTYHLGARWQKTAQGLQLSHVASHSAAERAHLSAGDMIIAINHFSVEEWQNEWQKLSAGDHVLLHFWRDHQLKTTTLTLKECDQSQEAVLILDNTACKLFASHHPKKNSHLIQD